MSHSHISAETIVPSLKPISSLDYIYEHSRPRKGYSLIAGGDLAMLSGAQVEQGDDPLTFGQTDFAKTMHVLRGAVRSLRSGSIIRADSFVLPVEIDRESVENYMYNRDFARVAFGRIQVTEPNAFGRTPYAHSGYFRRSDPFMGAPVEGIARILNEDADTFLDPEMMNDMRAATRHLVRQVRTAEGRRVDDFIQSVIDTQT